MTRRIVAACAVLAVLLVAGCSQVAGPTTPPFGPGAVTMIRVPSVAGSTEKAAIETLTAAGLEVIVRYTADKAHVGVVVAEPVPIGDSLAPGSPVTIVVGYDGSLAIVPDVIGHVRRDAEARLMAAGLKALERVGTSTDTTVSAGQVFKQSPDAGTPLAKGHKVTIYFLGHK
jgi:beta-lactam-binding protein with PASTA domain